MMRNSSSGISNIKYVEENLIKVEHGCSRSCCFWIGKFFSIHVCRKCMRKNLWASNVLHTTFCNNKSQFEKCFYRAPIEHTLESFVKMNNKKECSDTGIAIDSWKYICVCARFIEITIMHWPQIGFEMLCNEACNVHIKQTLVSLMFFPSMWSEWNFEKKMLSLTWIEYSNDCIQMQK